MANVNTYPEGKRPESLSRLVSQLGHIPGSGHEAHIETPDGKRWVFDKIVQVMTFDDRGETQIETVVKLKRCQL